LVWHDDVYGEQRTPATETANRSRTGGKERITRNVSIQYQNCTDIFRKIRNCVRSSCAQRSRFFSTAAATIAHQRAGCAYTVFGETVIRGHRSSPEFQVPSSMLLLGCTDYLMGSILRRVPALLHP